MSIIRSAVKGITSGITSSIISSGGLDVYKGGKGTLFPASGSNFYSYSSRFTGDINQLSVGLSLKFTNAPGSTEGILSWGNGFHIFRSSTGYIQCRFNQAAPGAGSFDIRSTSQPAASEVFVVWVVFNGSTAFGPNFAIYFNGANETVPLSSPALGTYDLATSAASGTEFLNFSGATFSNSAATYYQYVHTIGTYINDPSVFSDGKTLLNIYDGGNFGTLPVTPTQFAEAKFEGGLAPFIDTSATPWSLTGSNTQNEDWPQ